MPKAKEIVQPGFLKVVSIFFEYDTPTIVHIRSKKVGFINRVIQAAILAYIIG
jgi:P2X purinoceptor 4